jgi:hypothetical protein
MNGDGEFVSRDCTLLLVCTRIRWAVIICGLGKAETRPKEKPQSQVSEYITKLMRTANSMFFLQPLFVNMLAIDQFSPAVNLMRAYLATITLIPLSSTTYQNEFLQITRNRRKTEGYLCPRKQITDGE